MTYIKTYKDLKQTERKLDFSNLVQGFKQFNKEDFWNVVMVSIMAFTLILFFVSMINHAKRVDQEVRAAVLLPAIGQGSTLKLQGN